jgi:SAM-dependent methyltransferase
MGLLKILRTIHNQGPREAWRRVMTVAPGYVRGVRNWRLRKCECCQRLTLVIADQYASPELQTCLFCSANERFELLAMVIRNRYGSSLAQLDVLELDPHSPLRSVLGKARTYTRSYYQENSAASEKKNGAVREDITALTFKNGSLDLIVSSDVLEHVPKLEIAFSETARVLRPGGIHVFTVPPRGETRRRAELVNGEPKHLEPPEYHRDPLCPNGILAFWDIGPDLPMAMPSQDLKFSVALGPVGIDHRVVWIAERIVA